MANASAKLVLYAKVEGESGWRRFKPVFGGNGKISPGRGWMTVPGQKEQQSVKFKSFTYQQRTFLGTKTVYKNLGTDAAEALLQVRIEQGKREGRKVAAAKGVVVVEEDESQTIEAAIKRVIDRRMKRNQVESAYKCLTKLGRFRDMLKRDHPHIQFIEQITPELLEDFHAYLRTEFDNNERTVSDSHRAVRTMLTTAGWSQDKVVKQTGRPPQPDKKIVIAYRRDTLSTLFGHIEAKTEKKPKTRKLLYTALKLLLMTGLRDAEMRHLRWTSVDLEGGTLKVENDPLCRHCRSCRRGNPPKGFRIKDKEERIIPLPPELITLLRERRASLPNAKLVVGRWKDDKPARILGMLKIDAAEAGLNCGNCEGCRRGTECHKWQLHSFRRTYATMLHRNGAPIKQIMKLMGHSDMRTTLKYLAETEVEEDQDLVKAINWS